jgi:hypothetical protein
MRLSSLAELLGGLASHSAVVPSKDGTHNHREVSWREQAVAAEHATKPVVRASKVPARPQRKPRDDIVIASGAKQSMSPLAETWIASSLALLAMTAERFAFNCQTALRCRRTA